VPDRRLDRRPASQLPSDRRREPSPLTGNEHALLVRIIVPTIALINVSTWCAPSCESAVCA
jgi:hypothetical protein